MNHSSQQPNRTFHVQQNEAELEKSQNNTSFAASTQQVEIEETSTGTSSLLWDNEEAKKHQSLNEHLV
jgi:hypothetical protein